MKRRNLTFIFSLVILFYSCNRTSSNKVTLDAEGHNIQTETQQNIYKSKNILFSIPSPIEIAILLNKLKVQYNKALPNPITKANQYTSEKDISINLGVYIADLSFSSLFNSQQDILNYMAACKLLAEKINILDAINTESLKKLEDNFGSKEVVLDIISDTYMASNSHLIDNEQILLSTYIIMGAWIEGIYLITQTLNKELIRQNIFAELLINQKLTLDLLLQQLEVIYNKKNTNINEIVEKLTKIKKTFSKFNHHISDTKTEYDKEQQITVIKSKSKIEIRDNDFTLLQEQVKKLRNTIII